jgi:hypothetical protein
VPQDYVANCLLGDAEPFGGGALRQDASSDGSNVAFGKADHPVGLAAHLRAVPDAVSVILERAFPRKMPRGDAIGVPTFMRRVKTFAGAWAVVSFALNPVRAGVATIAYDVSVSKPVRRERPQYAAVAKSGDLL